MLLCVSNTCLVWSKHSVVWLLQLAFDHVGSMPMSKIQEHRAEKQAIMSADLRQRSSKKNLHRAIQRGSSGTGLSGKGALALVALHRAVSRSRFSQHTLTVRHRLRLQRWSLWWRLSHHPQTSLRSRGARSWPGAPLTGGLTQCQGGCWCYS